MTTLSTNEIKNLMQESGSNTIEVTITVSPIFFHYKEEAKPTYLSELITGSKNAQVDSFVLVGTNESGIPSLKTTLTISDELLDSLQTIEQQHSDLIGAAIEVKTDFSIDELESFVKQGKTLFAIPVQERFFRQSEEVQLNYISVSIFGYDILTSGDVEMNLSFGGSPLTHLSYMNVSIVNLAEIVATVNYPPLDPTDTEVGASG